MRTHFPLTRLALVIGALFGLLAILTGVADAAAVERFAGQLPGKATVTGGAASWGAPLFLAGALAMFAAKGAKAAKPAPRRSIVTNTSTEDRPTAVRAILTGESPEDVAPVKPQGPWTPGNTAKAATHLSAVLGCFPADKQIRIDLPITNKDGLPHTLKLPAGGTAMASLGGIIEVYGPEAVELVKVGGIETRRVKVTNQNQKDRDHGTPRPIEGGVFRLDQCLESVLWSPRIMEIIQGVGEPLQLPAGDADGK